MILEIRTCNNCRRKYVTDEGTDNQNICKCGKKLSENEDKRFFVPDEQLAKFIEKNYKSNYLLDLK